MDSAYFVARSDTATRTMRYFIGYADDAPVEAYLSTITALSLDGEAAPITSTPLINGTRTCSRGGYAGQVYIGPSCNISADLLWEIPEAVIRNLASRHANQPRVPMIVTRFQITNDDLDHFVLFPSEAAGFLTVVDRERAALGF